MKYAVDISCGSNSLQQIISDKPVPLPGIGDFVMPTSGGGLFRVTHRTFYVLTDDECSVTISCEKPKPE
jgi:hypothetical protein